MPVELEVPVEAADTRGARAAVEELERVVGDDVDDGRRDVAVVGGDAVEQRLQPAWRTGRRTVSTEPVVRYKP